MFLKTNISNTKFHILFLIILSLNYLIPFLIFGSFTLFYHDALDSEIVYNHVLGQILKNDTNQVDIFLGGSIKNEYMRRLHQPYMYLYTTFGTEKAYWIIDILVKITSYFSFFVLAKKTYKNFFVNTVTACLFASINLPTHEGFGLSFLPYIVYLNLYKKDLNLKHLLLIVLFGANSDFIFTIFLVPGIMALIFILKKKLDYNFFLTFFLFIFFIIVSNYNLIIINFKNIIFHREEFLRLSYDFKNTIIYFFSNIFNIQAFSLNSTLVRFIPYTIIYIPIFIFSCFVTDNKIKKILLIIISSAIFLSFLKFEYIAYLINNSKSIFKTLTWDYIARSYIFLYPFIALLIIKNGKFKKTLIIFSLISISTLQINSSIIPFYKEKILKINNYQNLYTFYGYYNFYDYGEIKKIVKDSRVISVGLDPMVAVYNGIKTIDGYHNLYPLDYKKKFRKIIEIELDNFPKFKDYYDNYGSRVYASLYEPKDKKNINLNYDEAKKLNAKFVISKYMLNSKKLNIIIDKCRINQICLYEIK